jgi:hypothetical protein
MKLLKISAPMFETDNEIPNGELKPGQDPEENFVSNGLATLDDTLTQEHVNTLQEQNMKYLGAGWYGVAFEVNNSVKKYTFDQKEYKTANTIIVKQNGNKPLPGLVTVYATKNLTNEVQLYKRKEDPNYPAEAMRELFVISMEKVTTLTKQEKEIFKLIYKKHLLKESIEVQENTIITLVKNYLMNLPQMNYLKENKKNAIIQSIENNQNFIIEIVRFFKILREHDMQDVDIYCENVGKRGETIVVLDLGSIEFYRE